MSLIKTIAKVLRQDMRTFIERNTNYTTFNFVDPVYGIEKQDHVFNLTMSGQEDAKKTILYFACIYLCQLDLSNMTVNWEVKTDGVGNPYISIKIFINI